MPPTPSTAIYLLHSIFGAQLKFWAPQIHAIVLSVLALAWGWPVLAAIYRRLPRSKPEVEWVQLWRCPDCGNFNRRATLTCTHCEYHLKIGGLQRWIPLKLSEAAGRNAKRLVGAYRALGWAIFYGLTLFAFFKLRLYAFDQSPVAEIMASVVLMMLLIPLMFFRLAFRPQLKSPVSFLLDSVAGLVSCVGLLICLMWWAMAASQPVLAEKLSRLYAVSIGKYALLQNTPFLSDAPNPPPAAKTAPPQKAARRAF